MRTNLWKVLAGSKQTLDIGHACCYGLVKLVT